jgi:uncharacterized protein
MTAEAGERVRHDAEAQRFTIILDDAVAVLDYRRIDAATLDYHHTFVPHALRGRGLASELTAAALRYALERQLRIVPSCPFVAAYIDSHPEFQPLLAGRR